MSICAVCRNGHVLKFRDTSAGKLGVCPVCRSRLRIPDPEDVFNEDAIMNVLQPEKSGLLGHSLREDRVHR